MSSDTNYHKGYDFFVSIPDFFDELSCKVCGEICDVTREVKGPMSYAGAIGGSKTKHDEFKCPNSGKEWHLQALLIVQDMRDCNSPSIRKIMQEDVNKILSNKAILH